MTQRRLFYSFVIALFASFSISFAQKQATNSAYDPGIRPVTPTFLQAEKQKIALTSTWVGMAWSGDGKTLYVAGGNASGGRSKADPVAPVYEFSYANGKLSDKPTGRMLESTDPRQVWWAGLAYLPAKHWLYALNRGTERDRGNVVVFDAKTKQIVTRIPVETTPYEAVLSKDGKRLFMSNCDDQRFASLRTDPQFQQLLAANHQK